MKDKLISVFSGERMEAEVLKGVLEASGILAMIKDNSLGAVTSFYAYSAGAVELLVCEKEEQMAHQILQTQPQIDTSKEE